MIALNTQKTVGLLFFFWLVTQIAIYVLFGVKEPIDSVVYINSANNLMRGALPDSHDIYYIGYSLIITAIFYLGGGLKTVVLTQIILSGIALSCLYQAVFKITLQHWVAFIAAFLYLFWFKIQIWNVYIYTESVFTSFLIISFFILVSAKKWYHYLFFLPIFLFTALIRPTAFAFILALIIFCVIKLYDYQKTLTYIASIVVVILITLLLNKLLEVFPLVDSYQKAEVIYPNISLFLKKPDNLNLPNPNYSPLLKVLAFIWLNPLYFMKLSFIKLTLFFANVKPYFSVKHNLYIICILYPLYAFAIKGFLFFNNDRSIKYFLLAFILGQGITVMLTSENWDGRFLIPVLPFIFILSAIGIYGKGRNKLWLALERQRK